jgi:Cft2 family RNA processing exonuclease
VLIEGGGRRVFVSGDISSEPQLTVPAAHWPTDLGEVDLFLLESTYGGKTRGPAEVARAELVRKAGEVLRSGGSVILASFALGRAQELLTVIAEAMERGELPKETPVCIDGMIRTINATYRDHNALRLPPGAFDIGGEFERQDAIHRARRTPTIIVTTSGMLAGGPAVEYARSLLEDPRHRLILTGYQDENAPSKQLRKLVSGGTGGSTVKLPGEDGEPVEFRAAARAIEIGLSAHADQAGLVEYASKIEASTIALVHGEPPSQAALKEQILRRIPGCEVVCGPSELSVR